MCYAVSICCLIIYLKYREILSIFVKSLELGKFYFNLFNFFLTYNCFHLHLESKLHLTLLLSSNPNLGSCKKFELKPILFFTYLSYFVLVRFAIIYLYFSRSLEGPVFFFLFLFWRQKDFCFCSIFSHIFSLIGKVSAFEAASYWFKSSKVLNFLIFISLFFFYYYFPCFKYNSPQGAVELALALSTGELLIVKPMAFLIFIWNTFSSCLLNPRAGVPFWFAP